MNYVTFKSYALAFLAWLFWCTAGGLASLGLYWLLLDRAPPFDSVSVSLSDRNGMPTDTFKRGDVMLVTRENCIHYAVRVFISRELVRLDGDRISYILPSNPFNMAPACPAVSTIGMMIPLHVLPGRYAYRVTYSFDYNPIASGAIVLKIPELTVLP